MILLFSVAVFIGLNAYQTVSAVDEMLKLAEKLPQNTSDFQENWETNRFLVQKVVSLWDEKFPHIAFTAGYENTNRCDEAIGALTVYFENKSGIEFFVSLQEFQDALQRLRILEGFHLEGIF